ncbi:MAG: PPC domain-containing protein [Anaerolineae bacterium]|nr:PPC domain-containing protein [Anaerolineae bacterium]
MMKCRITALILTLACALGMMNFARAQADSYTPFSWMEGDIALAYPADWPAPIRTTMEMGAVVQLQPAGENANLQISLEIIETPVGRLFDLLYERMRRAGVTVSVPVNSTLMGLAATEVRGEASTIGIGRGTLRADGNALLIYGSADAAASDALAAIFEDVAGSLTSGARQMPLIPGGDGVRFDRIGGERLELNRTALGSLETSTAAQSWTYAGMAGEEISVFTTDINRLESLNLRLRMTSPDGALVAENDSHNGGVFYGLFSLYDAALSNVVLPADGVYTIAVDSVFGTGVYGIGVERTQSLELDPANATRVQGVIDDVFAAETWSFAGRAGEVYTFTMFAAEGTTLDPALRLFAPDGSTLAQNDDARDVSLGLNAQLVRIVLPADGIYRLEATRYAGEGEGAYEIVIVATA